MKPHISIDPKYSARECTLFIAFIIAMIFVFCFFGIANGSAKRVDNLDHRVTKAERTLVLLHTCFPHAVYKADASPECPAFKAFVTREADKNQATFAEGK